MPKDFELKVGLSQAPDTASDGSSAARACRTRASASFVRNVASATTGTSPDASRTASANESRSGGAEGACALTVRGAATRQASRGASRRLLIPEALERQVGGSGAGLFYGSPFTHAG